MGKKTEDRKRVPGNPGTLEPGTRNPGSEIFLELCYVLAERGLEVGEAVLR